MAGITEINDFAEMTLKEALNKISNLDAFISVGPDCGSGWLYIGKTDEASAFFENEDASWIDTMQRFIDKRNAEKVKTELTLKKWNPIREQFIEKIRAGEQITEEERLLYNRARFKVRRSNERLQYFKNYVSGIEAKTESWVPFMKRKIKRIYSQDIITPHTINIIFEGREIGGVWTIEEFKEHQTKQIKRRII